MGPRGQVEPQRARSAISRWLQVLVGIAGSAEASCLALLLVALALGVGVVVGFSSRWTQALVTVSALVTFAMVFLIQHTTDRQLRAVLLKLDELLRAAPEADEELVGAEHRPLHEQEFLESGEGRPRVSEEAVQ